MKLFEATCVVLLWSAGVFIGWHIGEMLLW